MISLVLFAFAEVEIRRKERHKSLKNGHKGFCTSIQWLSDAKTLKCELHFSKFLSPELVQHEHCSEYERSTFCRPNSCGRAHELLSSQFFPGPEVIGPLELTTASILHPRLSSIEKLPIAAFVQIAFTPNTLAFSIAYL